MKGCRRFKIGEATGFICGGTSKHICDSNLSLLLLENGKRIMDTPDNREKHDGFIVGGSVACSICGRAAIDNAPYM